ncbi:SLC13 family permease [Vulcanisaeta thermophila]|uniref:SLC13 family permease n=1 Tax=Vulcanisaeta thermophila TaxID=867917 RepID=UPI0008539EF5|nr:SLC13 family permease [Vulcanisaeta thermophila]
MLTYGELYVIAVLLLSTVLLLTRVVRYDVVGLLTMILLVIGGIVPVTRALDYFGSTVVIVLISIMIISRTLEESGFLDKLADAMIRALGSEVLIVILTLLLVALVSGFMSDVALVAIFIPFMYALSKSFNKKLSKYLIPLSYSAIIGGRYTIIGTSTNLIINQLWYDRYHQYLSLFQFLPVGLGIVLTSIPVLLLIHHVMPSREAVVTSIEDLRTSEYLVEARVGDDCEWVGLSKAEVERRYHVKIRSVLPRRLARSSVIRSGMTLIVQVSADTLTRLSSIKGLRIVTEQGELPSNAEVVEAMVTGNSGLVGYSLDDVDAESKYGITILGLSLGGRRVLGRIRHITLRPGDSLLIIGEEERVARFLSDYGLMPLRGGGVRIFNVKKGVGAIAALAFATTASLLGLNIALAFLIPTLALVVSNVVNYRRVYQYVDWPVIVFIATYLSLGYAVETSGLSALMARVLPESPIILFLITALIANFVNNVTAAVVMTPIALLYPNPLAAVTIVAMASSSTFLTPYSHPANLMVLGPGNYRVRDYLMAGALVMLVVLTVTLYLTHSLHLQLGMQLA